MDSEHEHENQDQPTSDHLWQEYAEVFRDFDDLTLARWMAQTLGQFKGRVWRLSHPLMGAYRLAAQAGQDREVWHRRLAAIPAGYWEAPCCGAPVLPMLSRDLIESGLQCQHCGGTLAEFGDLPVGLQAELGEWARQYAPVHAVSHWNEEERKKAGDYDAAFDQAGEQAEDLLAVSGGALAPKLLEIYPAVVWEDQDECLDVRPEDVQIGP